MPSKAPSGVDTIRAEAKLTLTRKGRVYLIEILKGSGDDSFDKQWRKSLDEWRFIPAVTPEGEPTESTVHVIYTNTGVTVQPYSPDGSSDTTTRNVINESERIEKLTCKDFAWEYELLVDALPRRIALLDPLLKTPQVMYAAATPLTDDQKKTLHDRYDQLLSDAVKHCRDNPTDAFWQAVLKPAIDAALTPQ
ncbi:MAG TPA: energy transducer TonB [Steroidobacteraceae bacterium]|nr:energy transducer TonB [Steroidobacteraceae bacterium]